MFAVYTPENIRARAITLDRPGPMKYRRQGGEGIGRIMFVRLARQAS